VSAFQSQYACDGVSRAEGGLAAIRLDKEIAEKYHGILTDEKIQQILRDFKPTHDLHGMDVAYLYQNATQSSDHSRFSDLTGNWNGLTVSDVFGDKAIKIGYVAGWLGVSEYMSQIFMVLSFLIVLMIAPVFSGEYSGADSIILTTKYGRTKCGKAKCIAAILSALAVTAFVAAFNVILALIVYGHEGLDCSILFAPAMYTESFIPYNITCFTLIAYQVLLAFTCTIGIVGITLLLSSISKTQVVTLIASAASLVLPFMLPIAKDNPIFRWIALTPLYHVQFATLMSLEQMSNSLLYAIWALPAAIAAIVLGSNISRRIFAKHQVS
ncbi:MAG: ABC transporter permease, partial [Clostridia bacterium]